MPAIGAYVVLWLVGIAAGLAGAPVGLLAAVVLAMACLAFRHEARHIAKRVAVPVSQARYTPGALAPLPLSLAQADAAQSHNS